MSRIEIVFIKVPGIDRVIRNHWLVVGWIDINVLTI